MAAKLYPATRDLSDFMRRLDMNVNKRQPKGKKEKSSTRRAPDGRKKKTFVPDPPKYFSMAPGSGMTQTEGLGELVRKIKPGAKRIARRVRRLGKKLRSGAKAATKHIIKPAFKGGLKVTGKVVSGAADAVGLGGLRRLLSGHF